MDARVHDALGHYQTIDLTTTGRRTGKARRIEIALHNLGGRLLISGMPFAGRTRAWLLNVRTEPGVTLHLRADPPIDVARRGPRDHGSRRAARAAGADRADLGPDGPRGHGRPQPADGGHGARLPGHRGGLAARGRTRARRPPRPGGVSCHRPRPASGAASPGAVSSALMGWPPSSPDGLPWPLSSSFGWRSETCGMRSSSTGRSPGARGARPRGSSTIRHARPDAGATADCRRVAIPPARPAGSVPDQAVAGSASSSARNRSSAPGSSAWIRFSASLAMNPRNGGAPMLSSSGRPGRRRALGRQHRPHGDRQRAAAAADLEQGRRLEPLHGPDDLGVAGRGPQPEADPRARRQRRVQELGADDLGHPARQVRDARGDPEHVVDVVGEVDGGGHSAHGAILGCRRGAGATPAR